MISLARFLIVAGLLIFLAGGLLYILARSGLPLGRLPGDIRVERDGFTCIFPLVTSILLSIFLTVVLNLIARYLNR